MDAFEGCGDPAGHVEDVNLDAVPIDHGLDEIDPEPEMTADRLQPVGRPQHPVVGIEAHPAVLPVGAEPPGKVVKRIVGDRRGVDPLGQPPLLQDF